MKFLQQWYLYRGLVDRLGVLRPFSRGASRRALFITENNPISQSQVFPFLFYGRQLEATLGIQIRELPLARFRSGNQPFNEAVDFVFFQTWFDLTAQQMDELACGIHSQWPGAKLIYLDWFAPTDLRYAEALNSHVSAYVKKQVLSDFSAYGKPLVGHTNLTDFYCRKFGIDEPPSRFNIPNGFRDKLVLGSSFEQSPEIIELMPRSWRAGDRPIDLHSRITAKGTAWYSGMRQEALDATEKLLDKFNVRYEGKVSKRQYVTELRQSKMCFSPFGYGEVCWRDYEAMACGALLLKPDMSHITMNSNPFRPYETYIPLAWDLSDLKDKVEYYLNNKSERLRITETAYHALKKRHTSEAFLVEIEKLLVCMGLTSASPIA